MSGSNSAKIVARNVAAIRRFGDQSGVTQVIAGNPVATRLESRRRQLLSRNSSATFAI